MGALRAESASLDAPDGGSWYRIVGVVADAPLGVPGGPAADTPAVYLSVLQHPVVAAEVVARSAVPIGPGEGPLAGELRRAAVEAGWTARGPATSLASLIHRLRAPLRWLGALDLLLGLAALVLAGVGVEAALRAGVERRRGELGLRRAVGASRTALRRLVLREALSVAGFGAVAGLCLSLVVGRAVQTLLPGTPILEPRAFVALVLALTAAALAGALRPAARAAAVSPAEALRGE